MKKGVFACLFIFITFACSSAFSQDKESGKVTDIEKGEKAPFAGTLLDPVAYAKITLKNKYAKSKKILKLKEKIEKLKVKHKFKQKAKERKLEVVKEGYNQLQKRDNKEIQFLRKYAIKNGGGGGNLWTGIGIGTAAGMLMTVGAILTVELVPK